MIIKTQKIIKFEASACLLTTACLCCALLPGVVEGDVKEEIRECQDVGELRNNPFNVSCIDVCPSRRTQDISLVYCAKNCREYLRCIARHQKNGDRVDLLINPTGQCDYPLYYHVFHGYSWCHAICRPTRKSNFCLVNCPGYNRTCGKLTYQVSTTKLSIPPAASVKKDVDGPTSSDNWHIPLFAAVAAMLGFGAVIPMGIVCRRKMTADGHAPNDNNAVLRDVAVNHDMEQGESLLSRPTGVAIQDTRPHSLKPPCTTGVAQVVPPSDETIVKLPQEGNVSLHSTDESLAHTENGELPDSSLCHDA